MTTTESITPRAIALSDEATQHLTSATLKDNTGLQGRGLIIANRASRTRSGFVDQSVETMLSEPFAPLRHRGRTAADVVGDLLRGQGRVRTPEHDLASPREVLRGRVSARPTLELSAFVPGERDLSGWSSSLGHGVPLDAGSDTNKNATPKRKFPNSPNNRRINRTGH